MSSHTAKVSSGIDYLDRLIDCLTIGDNVIWQVETGAFVELYCRAFIKASLKDNKNVIVISFNNSPKNILSRMGAIANNPNVTLVDCFTSGKGDNSGIFLDLYKTTYKKYKCKVMHVEKPADVAGFIKIINEIEETNPRGTRYIFDSITGMQDLWEGDEQIMRFFTRQCPRLYELDTVAYWILEKNAHSEKFRAQLSHITQVVIDLTIENGVCNLTVVKAVNHASSELLKPHSYEVINDTIEFIAGTDTGLSNIGRRIREIRQQKEISQAQLATAAGVTASTISQVENNTISLSLPALLRLTKALDISIGTLFDEKHGTSSDFLFRAKNRSPLVTARPGVSASAIIPEDAHNRFEASLVTIAPGAAVSPHFIVNKGDEFGFLLSGNVELEMHGRTYIMNEGDTVRFTADVPSRWANNSEKAAKLLWIVCR